MDRLEIHPLLAMTDETSPDRWSRYHPGGEQCCAGCGHEIGEWWEVTVPLRLYLPGYRLVTSWGARWRMSDRGYLDVDPGYCWDGASGPAIDDPQAVMASLCHDIACTRIDYDDGSHDHPVQGYVSRHNLYRAILRAGGGGFLRSWMDFVGLVAGQGIKEWRDAREEHADCE